MRRAFTFGWTLILTLVLAAPALAQSAQELDTKGYQAYQQKQHDVALGLLEVPGLDERGYRDDNSECGA